MYKGRKEMECDMKNDKIEFFINQYISAFNAEERKVQKFKMLIYICFLQKNLSWFPFVFTTGHENISALILTGKEYENEAYSCVRIQLSTGW